MILLPHPFPQAKKYKTKTTIQKRRLKNGIRLLITSRRVLTVHRHSDHCSCSITKIIEWSTTKLHLIYSLANGCCVNCNISSSCGVKQTFLFSVESILCRWVGLCTAGEVEVCIHNNSVVNQISCHICVYWMIICN